MREKYKIGIFGSSAGDMSAVLPRVPQLVIELVKHKDELLLITGAGKGLPYEIASAAAQEGVEVWGFSDSVSREDHAKNYPTHNLEIYKKLFFIAPDFPLHSSSRACKKYRNVVSTGTCDAGIIIAGSWGTLNEFTDLVDQQKLAGVWTCTGGAADELPALTQKIKKEGQGQVLFENQPEKLVEQLLSLLKS